jgi:hypothetical protein
MAVVFADIQNILDAILAKNGPLIHIPMGYFGDRLGIIIRITCCLLAETFPALASLL